MKRFFTTIFRSLHYLAVRAPAIGLMIVIVAVGFVYLFQVNTAATAVYDLRQQQEALTTAENDLERLELRMAQERSAEGLSVMAKQLGLEEPATVTYLEEAALDVAIVTPGDR